MAEKFPHLTLPESESFMRKKRIAKFGYEKAKRDTKNFYQTEIQKLDLIADGYKKDKQKYSKYFDPNLIFKIRLGKKGISDKIFRDELNRAGIKTISSCF